MKIRQAHIDDLEQIVNIYNQAIEVGQRTADTVLFTTEQRLEWFREHNEKTYPLLVATEDDEILGYLTISPYRNGRLALRKTAEVSYYIHFQHHRKGIGSFLMNRALELCSDLHLENLIAILIGSNDGSVGLLKKHGFEEWGRLPNIVDFGEEKFDHLYYGIHIK
ncbi:MAG: N-acetyltransferase [Planctomycetota bacterium]|nr:MAG: N-acetyltransferase [Planctomycetota bacterium]